MMRRWISVVLDVDGRSALPSFEAVAVGGERVQLACHAVGGQRQWEKRTEPSGAAGRLGYGETVMRGSCCCCCYPDAPV